MTIPTIMTAARLHAAGAPLRLEDVPVPEIGGRDVLVRVEACGLNGGDIHLAIEGSIPLHVTPITIGHETAGTVAAVGEEVTRLAVGERVHCDPILSCNACENCLTGRRLACANVGVAGMTYFGHTEEGLARFERYAHGSATTFVRMPEENVERISDGVPFEIACKFGVLGTAYRAVKAARVAPHHTVVVNAATGGTGVATLLVARLFGARKVIAIGRTRAHLERLPGYLGDPVETICSAEEEVGTRITDLTGGLGMDVLIDFSPAEADLAGRLVSYLKPGGVAVLAGGTAAPLTLDYRSFMVGSVSILGTHAYTQADIRELDGLVAEKRLDVSQLLTHRYPLAQTDEALQTMRGRAGGPVWVVISPG